MREWCGKRGLFAPSVKARGPGKVALYSWQDVVALRVFREIYLIFGGRAVSWADGVAEFQRCLAGQFFPNLWGRCAVFVDQRSATVLPASGLVLSGPALVIPLDPHLSVIADQATPEEMQGQLPLITGLAVKR